MEKPPVPFAAMGAAKSIPIVQLAIFCWKIQDSLPARACNHYKTIISFRFNKICDYKVLGSWPDLWRRMGIAIWQKKIDENNK